MPEEPFRLFRDTRDGIPPEVDEWLGQPVQRKDGITAIEPSEYVEQAALEILDDLSRHPNSRAQVNAEIFIIVAWHNKHHLPLSPLVLKALARALDLTKDDGTAVVTETVLERFGYPRVRELEAFLIASRLDGEADAEGETLSLKGLQRRVREELGLDPDPEPEDAGRSKPSRDTLKRFRAMPEYQRRRETTAGLARIHARAYGNGKQNNPDPT